MTSASWGIMYQLPFPYGKRTALARANPSVTELVSSVRRMMPLIPCCVAACGEWEVARRR